MKLIFFRGLATVIRTSSGTRKIPIAEDTGEASWIDEGEEIPESDATFGQTMLSAYKLGTMIKISNELLNDSAFDLEAYFRTEFARRIGNKEEEAFLTGDGSGKPTGIFNTTGGGQLGVTAASATAITADELIDLFYSLNSAYRKNAVWLLNDSTMKNIRKLKDSNGQYLWQPALHEGGFDTLLGKRIYTSPYAPELAAGQKTVAFGDFNYYWIGDRLGITFKRLNELYYGPDMVVDDNIAMEWARIPHFYYNYYVFQYATGYSAAIALSRRILREGAPAVKDYLGFLSGGCSKSPIDLLKGAGVDMTSPEPVNQALALFGELLDEMEELTEYKIAEDTVKIPGEIIEKDGHAQYLVDNKELKKILKQYNSNIVNYILIMSFYTVS